MVQGDRSSITLPFTTSHQIHKYIHQSSSDHPDEIIYSIYNICRLLCFMSPRTRLHSPQLQLPSSKSRSSSLIRFMAIMKTILSRSVIIILFSLNLLPLCVDYIVFVFPFLPVEIHGEIHSCNDEKI